MRRIDEIQSSQKRPAALQKRRHVSTRKLDVQTRYNITVANSILFNKLVHICQRNSKPAQLPKKVASYKQAYNRAHEIEVENRRLVKSIYKTMHRPNDTFYEPKKIVRRGLYQINKPMPLPRLRHEWSIPE